MSRKTHVAVTVVFDGAGVQKCDTYDVGRWPHNNGATTTFIGRARLLPSRRWHVSLSARREARPPTTHPASPRYSALV